jgi:hypothetical protein
MAILQGGRPRPCPCPCPQSDTIAISLERKKDQRSDKTWDKTRVIGLGESGGKAAHRYAQSRFWAQGLVPLDLEGRFTCSCTCDSNFPVVTHSQSGLRKGSGCREMSSARQASQSTNADRQKVRALWLPQSAHVVVKFKEQSWGLPSKRLRSQARDKILPGCSDPQCWPTFLGGAKGTDSNQNL